MEIWVARNALLIHRFIVRFAGALVVAFLWINIFGYFAYLLPPADALAKTLLLYALSEAVVILFSPIAMKYMRGSMLRGLTFGSLSLATAYCYVGALSADFFPHGAAVIGVLFGLYRSLYRVAYSVELRGLGAKSSSQGREIILALLPAIAGTLLSAGLPFPFLMFIGTILVLIAMAFLPFIPNVRESFDWSYRETFRQFLHRRNAQLVFGSMLEGVKMVALVVLWPLALIIVGVQSFGLLGALVSIALLVSVSFGRGRGYKALEHHVDGGTYVDEYTVVKEMGRAFGAAFACCAIATFVILF